MKRYAKLCLLALAAGLAAAPALAMEDGDKKFTLSGEVRSRYEYHNNITDYEDHTQSGGFLDDEIDFWPYRVRIGVAADFTDDIKAMIEIQNFGFFGSSLSGPYASSDDPLFQAFRGNFLTNETTLYQGYVEFHGLLGEMSTWRLGRQEHTLGNELHMGDLDFYNGLSFDGARFIWDFESFSLNAFYYMIEEASVLIPIGTGGGDDDWFLLGAHARWNIGDGENHFIEPYFFYNRDGGHPFTLTSFDQKIWTFGFLYGKTVDDVDEDGRFDWNFEAAFQSGDVGTAGSVPPNTWNPGFACAGTPDCSAGGSIIEAWFGFNFGDSAHHRLFVGTLMASGDDNPTDSDYDGFAPLFPDNHSNGRLGNLDLFGGPISSTGVGSSGMTDVMDINFGYEGMYSDGKHGFAAVAHMLTLSEDAGTPASDDIGLEIDFTYDYNVNEYLGFEIGYAHLLAGDLLDIDVGPAGADDMQRLWLQARVRW